MGQSIKWRIDRAYAFARKFHGDINLGDQVMQMYCHFSRNDAFKRYMSQREYLFRKTITVDDGDHLPADFLRYADSATYLDPISGDTNELALVTIEKIPFAKGQPLFVGLPTAPKIAFADQKILFFPTGITGVEFSYYWRPPDLWSTANTIPETTTDPMPEETEYAIVRGMVERAVMMTSGREVVAQMIEKNKLDSEEAAVQWFAEAFQGVSKDVQPFV